MREGNTLFDFGNKSFLSFVNNLTEDAIKSNSDYVIYRRGRDYYDKGRIKNVSFDSAENTVSAIVIGGEKYCVRIYSENGEIKGSCTCPYGDVCKHIIAVLILISEKGIEEKPELPGPTTGKDNKILLWKKYLDSLSHEELVMLVDKYAPSQYRAEIINRNSGKPEAKAIFRKTRNKIENLFQDEELLFSPSEFEGALLNNLNKLKGFESHLKDETGKLILFIIEEVNSAFDSGYLYLEDYQGDDFFESVEFCDFVVGFVRHLEFIEKIEFLQDLDESLNCVEYSTFEQIGLDFSDYFQNNEMKMISEFLLKNVDRLSISFISRLYKGISDILKEPGRIKLLKRLKEENETDLIEYCTILMSNEKYEEAFKELENIILSDRAMWNPEINLLYLELSVLLRKDLKTAALRAINNCPIAKVLLQIKRMNIREYSEISDFLKNKNPEEYLVCLENEKSFAKAVAFINSGKINEGQAFGFYKRNKINVVVDAEKFFENRIKIELPFTGESHYLKIAEALDQISAINMERAVKISRELRIQYKRRTSLIKMISDFEK
jgi:uncharacterized Zn finger protein